MMMVREGGKGEGFWIGKDWDEKIEFRRKEKWRRERKDFIADLLFLFPLPLFLIDKMRVFFADIVKNNNNIFNNIDEGYSHFGFNHFAPTIAGSAIERQQNQDDDDAAWMAIVNKANNNNNGNVVANNNNNDNDEDWIIAFPTKVVAKDRRQESCDDEAIKAAVAEMLEKLSSSSSSSSSLGAFAVSA